MYGRSDPDADQYVQPNPVHYFDDLFSGVYQSFAAANYTIIIVIADGALIDKGLNLIFQLQASDQGSTQDSQNQSDCHIGQGDAPIENAGQQDHRGQIDKRGGDQERKGHGQW